MVSYLKSGNLKYMVHILVRNFVEFPEERTLRMSTGQKLPQRSMMLNR